MSTGGSGRLRPSGYVLSTPMSDGTGHRSGSSPGRGHWADPAGRTWGDRHRRQSAARRGRAAGAWRPPLDRPVRAERAARVRRDGHGLPGPAARRWAAGRGQDRAPGARGRPGVPGPVRGRGGGGPAGGAVLYGPGAGRGPVGPGAVPGDGVRGRCAPGRRGGRWWAAGRVDAARCGARCRRGAVGRTRGRGRAPRPQAGERAAVSVGPAGDRLRHRPRAGRGAAAHPGRDAGRDAGVDGAGAVPRRRGRTGGGRVQLGQPGRVCGHRAQPVVVRATRAVAVAGRAGTPDPARRPEPGRAGRAAAPAGGVRAGQGPGPASDRAPAGRRAARRAGGRR